jgi:hypothetical protein
MHYFEKIGSIPPDVLLKRVAERSNVLANIST